MERAVRLDADKADAGILPFEVPACTDERPRRPQARDEVRNRPERLPPDLRASRCEMGSPVRLVVVLIQVPVFLPVVQYEILGRLLRSACANNRTPGATCAAIRSSDNNGVRPIRSATRVAPGRFPSAGIES